MIRMWEISPTLPKLLPLVFKRSVEDISKQNIDLRKGPHIIVYDDSYEAEAVVEKIKGEWWGRIVEGTCHATDAE